MIIFKKQIRKNYNIKEKINEKFVIINDNSCSKRSVNTKIVLKKLFYYIMVMMAVGMSATGCSSIECNLQGRVVCHYEFQDRNGNTMQSQLPVSVTLHRPEAETDSVFINRQANAATLDIPMSYSLTTDTMTLTLHLTESTSVSDMMFVTKENRPVFEEVDCAPRYNHTITAVSSTHNFIDSLIINNKQVNNNATKNIIIRLALQ